jgi:hypothetical protein
MLVGCITRANNITLKRQPYRYFLIYIFFGLITIILLRAIHIIQQNFITIIKG